MRALWLLAALPIAVTLGASQASALTAGGTAPGGPLSGTIRSACNGYNMDGTVNTSAGADLPGCIDRSVRGLQLRALEDRARH